MKNSAVTPILNGENFTEKENREFVELFIFCLILNNIKIKEDSSKNKARLVKDENYCCHYLKIAGYLSEKELSVVFDKKKKMILVGTFFMNPENLPEGAEIFEFSTLKDFSDSFPKITEQLR